MRKLMYAVLGFAASCGVCAYGNEAAMALPVVTVILFLICLKGGKRHFGKKLLFVWLGCLLGAFWYGHFYTGYLGPVLPMDGKTAALSVRAVDFGKSQGDDTFFDGILEVEDQTYLVHTRLKGDVTVEPGMVFSGDYHVTVSPGNTYNSGKGSFLYAYQKDELTVSVSEKRWFDQLAVIRRDINRALQETFPEDTYPFAQALLLGDTSHLSYEVDTAMKVSGVRHVVAVSGLHISILFGLLSMLTFRKRFLTALVGYPVLLFFAALTGFTPSVVRACLMAGLMLLAKLTDREYDGPTSLSFAVLVMLLVNPTVITVAGFQLSVASVAGIYLFTPGLVMWLRSFFGDVSGKTFRAHLIRWGTTSVAVTLGASVLTVPLCAYYFGMVSLVGVVTNLLTLWIISGIFYGILAVCLIFPAFPVAAGCLAEGVSWAVRYVLWMTKTMAAFPLAAVYTVSSYVTAWLIFLYILLAAFLLLKNRRPVIFACCAVLGLCLALTADWWESMSDAVRVTVLDVGQGQSILLQSEGRSFLVDCGGDSAEAAADRAAEALLAQGIRKLDGLIVTHWDSDHSNGIDNLLSRIDTERLFLPEVWSDLPDRTGIPAVCVAQNTDITFGDTVIRLFPAVFPGNSNEKSICVLFDTKKCDILVTGDRDGYGERSLLRNAQIPEVDILIAGHHGAASSTCQELLDAVKPEIVCISAGAGNFYGHPSPELLQRLAEFGCDVYRTDIQGTITIRR